MVIERGEIWWADLGTPRGSSPGFQRPIVIVQSDDFNQTKLNTVVGIVITSNLRLAQMPGNVALEKSAGRLSKDSVINVTQIVTIDRDDLLERIGSVPNDLMTRIDEGLRLVLSL
jgi:mRNA interferase MazF